jgi:hypothetical protein
MHEQVRQRLARSLAVDCCVGSPQHAVMVTVERVEEPDSWSGYPPGGVVVHNLAKDTWGAVAFAADCLHRPLCAHSPSDGEILVVDYNGEVFTIGFQGKRQWDDNGIPQRGIKGLKNISGTLYAVGLGRSVFRRDGFDAWTPISRDLAEQTGADAAQARERGNQPVWTGFDCIDGFNSDHDLYAAGGSGDVWWYDGARWYPVDIPLPTMQITGICCADDGLVYIVGRFGAVLRGRGDRWEVLQTKVKADFSDVACFQGKVYVASPARLFVVDQDRLDWVRYDARLVLANHGHLYVAHDMMMTAGTSSAALFDGQRWNVLFGGGYLDEEAAMHVLGTVLRAAVEDENRDDGGDDKDD